MVSPGNCARSVSSSRSVPWPSGRQFCRIRRTRSRVFVVRHSDGTASWLTAACTVRRASQRSHSATCPQPCRSGLARIRGGSGIRAPGRPASASCEWTSGPTRSVRRRGRRGRIDEPHQVAGTTGTCRQQRCRVSIVATVLQRFERRRGRAENDRDVEGLARAMARSRAE